MPREKAGLLKRYRKRIRLFLSMPTGWISVFLAIMGGGMLIASFCFQNYEFLWLPNVLVSCACGLITGVVLFALTNLRANKSIEIKTEYERMKAVFDYVQSRKREATFLLNHPIPFENAEDNWVYIDRVANSLEEISDLIEELPEHVFFDMLDYENNYPIHCDTEKQIKAISDSIEDFDDEAKIKELCSALLPVYDDLINWLNPAKKIIDDRYKELCRQIL